VRVVHGDVVIVDTRRAVRVLETSHPPSFYVPPEDVAAERLVPARGGSFCEWKGQAAYFDVVAGDRAAARAAWHYPSPTAAFASLAGYVSFYPGRVDGCFVDDERVRPQEGDFYGGWVTDEIVGPFKGLAGTRGW
jgi:uncharacterized protein (DUF427 family)